MADSVRVVICGDEGTGKSSIITSFIKGEFRQAKIQPVLPPMTINVPHTVSTTIVDTSALPQERNTLQREIRRSNVICLVYSDHYSYERVSLFWMPFFRSLGVNLPIVLCANKSDLYPDVDAESEMMPIMAEFKEIDSCVRSSAKEMKNIVELIYLCQRAVTCPIAPLFDSKEQCLKPAAAAALERIFFLCDRDQDGLLSDQELQDFQKKVFNKALPEDDLTDIKTLICKTHPGAATEGGINKTGWIYLNKMFVDKGRHETLWIILRIFHYTDNLSLKEVYLHPKFELPPNSSAELSTAGYRFFVDLFLLFDKDTDGGLNADELAALFAPTPGLPSSWIESNFPSSTVRSEAGHISLQGWLAQWSMTTFQEPKTTLEYLAYLGFESPDKGGTTAALKVTKPRRRRRRQAKVERNVVLCYVLGSSGCGKSSILDAFLNRPFNLTYNPTIKPRSSVNSVELQGGKQCYLILEELGELEPAILENEAKLDACDVVLYCYDSSNPDSFSHISELRKRYPQLDELPAVYAALKADLDKTAQSGEMQPEEYTRELGMSAPLHVSAAWRSISELFGNIAEAALSPASASPKTEKEPVDRTNMYIGIGVSACTALTVYWMWKRAS